MAPELGSRPGAPRAVVSVMLTSLHSLIKHKAMSY
jgi:hypothetical protein